MGLTMVDGAHRKLVERVAASRYLAKSARLRDLLIYLSDRVIEGPVEEIHEQEVGNKVFGRPVNYDTSADNIVRVHASTLRKRLEQYFAEEGAGEPVILEIPKGNYAPVFRKREVAPPTPAPAPRDRRVVVLGALAGVFALSTVGLLLRGPRPAAEGEARGPTVRMFWSQLFRSGHTTDLVLDDAGLGLYEELTGRTVALSEYFDRSYLRSLPAAEAVSAVVQRRQSSFANVSFLGHLLSITGREAAVVFARDYSFRQIKADNAVLLGQVRSNPWIEPFLPQVGIHWNFDKEQGTYFPVDTWATGEPKTFGASGTEETRESYCGIALVPNLGGSGTVLIVSATGGSAFNAAAGFLTDEAAMAALRKMLPGAGQFPYFEALVRVKGRSALPRDWAVVICRATRG